MTEPGRTTKRGRRKRSGEDTGDRANRFDPMSDSVLAAYLASVREWHGYIRFLGLPHLRENPDVGIDRLYVEPRLSRRHISPDTPEDAWGDTDTAIETIADNNRLVILGDPGSGKSTLVNWLAWHFANGRQSDWTDRLGRLVPMPLVLRDLKIGRGITWDGLVDVFLEHEMCRPLRGWAGWQPLLDSGNAFFLLDGLDEVGKVDVRADLRAAIIEGVSLYPGCRWLLTSRIIGYEQVPFAGDDPDDPAQWTYLAEPVPLRTRDGETSTEKTESPKQSPLAAPSGPVHVRFSDVRPNIIELYRGPGLSKFSEVY